MQIQIERAYKHDLPLVKDFKRMLSHNWFDLIVDGSAEAPEHRLIERWVSLLRLYAHLDFECIRGCEHRLCSTMIDEISYMGDVWETSCYVRM
jgi:hypothetical protein